jgi:hypothetical protein
MKYAVVMGSCAMIYIPSLTGIGSGIPKLIGWGINRHKETKTHGHVDIQILRQHGDHINQL